MKYLTTYLSSALIAVFFVAGAMVPVVVSAVDGTFVPLSSSKILRDALQGDLVGLINILVNVAVALAAVLAVIMVAIGGFKYMTTDSMFAMGNAKEQITHAIVGLLIVLAAIMVLKAINPNLVSMNLFNIAPVTE